MNQDASTWPKSSRDRLLAAAKSLIAEVGYEQASTSAIVRRAATSESQLVRYFGGKAGMLEAIFDESWAHLNANMSQINTTADARRALEEVLTLFIEALNRDPELAKLFLFEGRRVRGPQHAVSLSKGYFEFIALLHQIIRRGQDAGELSTVFNPEAILAALLGAAESLVRERIIATGNGRKASYSNEDIRQIFKALLNGLATNV